MYNNDMSKYVSVYLLLLSRVRLYVTPQTAARGHRRPSLSPGVYWSSCPSIVAFNRLYYYYFVEMKPSTWWDEMYFIMIS